VSTITLEAGQLGARLRSDANGAPKAVQRAMFSAGQRGKALLVKDSPVDRGILRNAWKVVRLSDGVEIVNDQPYAGIIEMGAKPFKMSAEGRKALEGWVYRKILQGTITLKPLKGKARKSAKSRLEQQAESIAYLIARKFERVGMKGKRFVYNNLDKLAELMDGEINRFLSSFFDRSA